MPHPLLPFHVVIDELNATGFVQYGVPRSGSTYQFVLLCLAVRLKYLDISDVPCRFTTNASLVRPHEVWKVHTYPSAVPNYTLAVSVPSRSSAAAAQIQDDLNASKGLPQPAVVQFLDEMQLAPLLEVSKYSWLLGLSAHDEVLLRSYMRWWEVLRRCCGPQQSVQNVLRLHGCPPTTEVDADDYAGCEAYNLTQVEVTHSKTALWPLAPWGLGRVGAGSSERDDMVSIEPGWCASWQAQIVSGEAFDFDTGRMASDFTCAELEERVRANQERMEAEFGVPPALRGAAEMVRRAQRLTSGSDVSVSVSVNWER